jgi:hypothetical protein
MNEFVKQYSRAAADVKKYAADRSEELSQYVVHPDFDIRGVVAPRVGAALHSILTEPNRDWHDDPVGETAFGAYVRGDHAALSQLGQALADEGHPLADRFNWQHLPERIDLDKKVLAASEPEVSTEVQRRAERAGVYSDTDVNPDDRLRHARWWTFDDTRRTGLTPRTLLRRLVGSGDIARPSDDDDLRPHLDAIRDSLTRLKNHSALASNPSRMADGAVSRMLLNAVPIGMPPEHHAVLSYHSVEE